MPEAQASEEKPEKPVLYKVQIDKTIYETPDPTPTGEQLLVLAQKLPPTQFALYEKPKGGKPIRIGLQDQVDLRDPGIERFITLPLDQPEGLGPRRDFALPADDMQWLDQLGLKYELVREGGALRVVVYNFPLCNGYNVPNASINVRIEAGYPDTQIDMVYFHPPLSRTDGRAIGAVSPDNFDGKTWQRWSRHRTPANPWRPGVDSLATHFALIGEWLSREIRKV